ncbi:MAG: UbiA family prenyltransferase [Candidatus Hinthialibacter antarcticus]|nr:UbiA family prenyltransferase [Candidatus Hinthialibacter antarcticus]
MNQSNRYPIADFWELCRPFTLLAPFMGFVCFALAGWSGQGEISLGVVAPVILIGALAAACLNAASNIINQYYDLEIDRINKPTRPIPSGRISPNASLIACVILYALSALLAYCLGMQFFVIVLFTLFLTYAYSGPPFRTKRHWLLANLTIAIPRGCLLVVAGWTAVRSAYDAEPWIIGAVFGLYIFGAATTKDFADIKGDRQGGCITLPIRFGVRQSAYMIAPFFVLPFVLLFMAGFFDWLAVWRIGLMALSVFLSVWGGYVAYLIVRKPDELATEANHVSWKHMYLMMVVGQVGTAAAYFLN